MKTTIKLGSLTTSSSEIGEIDREKDSFSLSSIDTYLEQAPGMYSVTLPFTGDPQDELTPGVLVVVGPTGKGKTKLVKDGLMPAFERAGMVGEFIHFNEEVTAPDRAISSEMDLHEAIHNFVRSENDFLIIDSFRYYIYNAVGKAAGKGGQNMALYGELTALDQVIHNAGKILVITLNPLAIDDEAYSAVVDSLKASIKGTIALSVATTSRSAEVHLRGNGRRRVDQNVSIKDLSDIDTDVNSQKVGPAPVIEAEITSNNGQPTAILKKLLKEGE